MREEGAVLLITLMMIVVITLLAIGTVTIAAKQRNTSILYQRQLEVEYVLQAALEKAKYELQQELEKAVVKNYRAVDLARISTGGQVTIRNLLGQDKITVQYKLEDLVDQGRKLNVNLAPQRQLQELAGIGQRLSNKIEQQRNKVPFINLVELKRVEGIAEEKLNSLKPLLTVCGQGQININTATAEVLTTFPGIGALTAANIIAYRQLNGPFNSKEDLKKVSGIGRVTYQKLADKISSNSNYFSAVVNLKIASQNLELSKKEIIKVGGQ
ncbi:MAG: helix-hairpin-helix domain-containing protein [Bacillota bacterium]